jgi:hypothetical protein
VREAVAGFHMEPVSHILTQEHHDAIAGGRIVSPAWRPRPIVDGRIPSDDAGGRSWGGPH